MAKLWEKGYSLNKEIEDYTVGEDYLLDQNLVEADVLGNLAHAKMLVSINILKEKEFQELKKALLDILTLHQKGEFRIKKEEEDVHTAVENFLVKRLGDLGRKIHTARSRNDQIILDLRLYTKGKLLEVKEYLFLFSSHLLNFAAQHKEVPMPGYTHSRQAMPSSVGLWAGAYLESLLDDAKILSTAYQLNDQCPLGSAAGYGVSLEINRSLTSQLLGFSRIQNNVLYVNNSRGKVESVVLFALSQIMLDLSKLAEDLILFTREEFSFFQLPRELCPGSSIMPQKRNPGALELLRAHFVEVESFLFQVLGILKGLPSGYNRDLQLTKAPLIKGLQITINSLKIAHLIMSKLKVLPDKMLKAFTPEIFAADEVLNLTKQGIPFRQAYKEIAGSLNELKKLDPLKNIRSKKHQGAPGNLGLEGSKRELNNLKKSLEEEKKAFHLIKEKLVLR